MKKDSMAKAELIVALDTQHVQSAYDLAQDLKEHVRWLKVGLELFVAAGPEVVFKLKELGYNIFLDLKMYDIPNTVYGGVLSAAHMGVDMLTIHIQGGERMALSAMEASLSTKQRPLIFGVSVLTSMGQGDLPFFDGDISELAGNLAHKASTWGLDGVVSSGHEVATIKAHCGNQFLCLTPGIRPQGSDTNDQRRLVTPEVAVKAGSDFLVVGRPITGADNPRQAAKDILAQMKV